MEFLAVCNRFLKFSTNTFKNATEFTSLKKAEEEIDEVCIDLLNTKPFNIHIVAEEYADTILALIDSANRAGISPEQIVLAMHRKTIINENRTWIQTEEGFYKHQK